MIAIPPLDTHRAHIVLCVFVPIWGLVNSRRQRIWRIKNKQMFKSSFYLLMRVWFMKYMRGKVEGYIKKEEMMDLFSLSI